jgi:hypothetical protein
MGRAILRGTRKIPKRKRAFANTGSIQFILLTPILTPMHEDLDFSTSIVTRREKPVVWIKQWRDKYIFGWEDPMTYLAGMPLCYGYSQKRRGCLNEDVELQD